MGVSTEGGYVTDEELELCQTLEPSSGSKQTSKVLNSSRSEQVKSEVTKSSSIGASVLASAMTASTTSEAAALAASAATSPSKEVLIGGDNNPSRR